MENKLTLLSLQSPGGNVKIITAATMSLINIIFSQDGSDIKDDVVRRIKEGPDRLSNIKVCSLNDRFLGVNSDHNAEVNVLIITPSMCSKISKHGDEDFKTVFPNVQKSLLLICDANSEQKVCSVISRSVNYSEIRQFHISNAMEWRYMLVPTIKAMASSDKEELHIPGINRYVIKPKQVDSVSSLNTSSASIQLRSI